MKLRDRIAHHDSSAAAHPLAPGASRSGREGLAEAFRDLKLRVHDRLMDTVDPSKFDTIQPAALSALVAGAVGDVLDSEGRLLTDSDRSRLVEEIQNEFLGLGPLEPLLRDHDVTDILVNGANRVYVERHGRLSKTDITFQDDAHLMLMIDRIVSRVGRHVDEASPMVDARLPDGSRINAIIPPLAIDGPALSIRRFARDRAAHRNPVALETLSPEMDEYLRAIVRGRLNILICGGTGTGKTTLLNYLSGFIPESERIVTIEDSAELLLQQPHVVRLEARPANLEGKGEITQRDLVRNCLRMRPDRIVVGEVRGAEVFEMLQAMSTGHDGSIATIHANSPRESLSRLELMMMLSGFALPERAMRQQIASAINVIIQMSRLSDGARKVMRISEITGLEGDTTTMQDVFEFARSGLGANGKVLGAFRAAKVRPAFARRLELAGFKLDFSPTDEAPK